MIATTNFRRTALGTVALTAALLAAGCSTSGKTSSTTTTTTGGASTSPPATAPATGAAGSSKNSGTAAATTITIKDFGYTVTGPARSGSKITVTNKDAQAHTVTADTGKAFDAVVEGGKTVTFTAPAQAGTYKFHCTYHSNMHGSLTIQK